jgi:hypothetical protein
MSPAGTGEPVSVIVADDQAVREGLVLLLGTLPGIAVAGEAADGGAARGSRALLADWDVRAPAIECGPGPRTRRC